MAEQAASDGAGGIAATLALSVVAGLVAFYATAAPGSKSDEPSAPGRQLCKWLQLPSEQADAVQRADPEFDEESRKLSKALCQARETLAGLLDDPGTPDGFIMAQVEKVIVAHNVLERRVVKHLLAVRQHLDRRQRRRLMGLCAKGVRRAARCRWRGGSGEARQPVGAADSRGRGRREGRGKGRRAREASPDPR